MGLTASYAIVKRHDGHVDVESRLGAGASFHVWIPAVLERTADGPPTSLELERGHGLVLVMDDDDMVRRVAGSIANHDPVST